MKIDTILWDVDGTLLNFSMAEDISVRECLSRYHIEVSDAQMKIYKKINQEFWEMLERGEITRNKLGPERFRKFLNTLGKYDIDPAGLDYEYQEALSQKGILMEGALEICGLLSRKGLRQYVVTNGTAFVQYRKLRLSGLDQFMEDIFISEELGHVKPEKAFFELCAERISEYDSSRTMIVGDSLTSDMQGGNHAGIRCCWYNPERKPLTGNVRIDYEIRELSQVQECL